MSLPASDRCPAVTAPAYLIAAAESRLRTSDVAANARAYGTLVDPGMEDEAARPLSGFGSDEVAPLLPKGAASQRLELYMIGKVITLTR